MSDLLNKIPFLKGKVDIHLGEVLSGASIAFVLGISGSLLAFLLNLLLVRVLGAEQFGIYLLAVTVCTIATVFGRFGLDNVLVRFTASGVSVGDWSSVKGVYHKGFLLAIITSSLSTAVLFIYAPFIAEYVFAKKELITSIRLIALAVIPMTFLFLYCCLLAGLKRIRDSQLALATGHPFFTLLGFFLIGRHWGLNGAVWSYVFGTVSSLVVGYVLFKSATPQIRFVKPVFDTRLLIRTTWPLLWVSSMHFINGWLSLIVLGIYRTTGEVAIYNMALRTAMLTSLTLLAVNSISSPKFSEFYRKGDMSELSRIGISSSRLVLLVSSPLLLVFILAPGFVLSVFGESFRAGSTGLIIMSIGQFINVATGSVAQMLAMTGHETVLRNIVIATSVLNTVLSVALIPAWGIHGAAVATAVCTICSTVIASYYVYKYLKIKIHAFARI